MSLHVYVEIISKFTHTQGTSVIATNNNSIAKIINAHSEKTEEMKFAFCIDIAK